MYKTLNHARIGKYNVHADATELFAIIADSGLHQAQVQKVLYPHPSPGDYRQAAIDEGWRIATNNEGVSYFWRPYFQHHHGGFSYGVNERDELVQGNPIDFVSSVDEWQWEPLCEEFFVAVPRRQAKSIYIVDEWLADVLQEEARQSVEQICGIYFWGRSTNCPLDRDPALLDILQSL
jgi:hypothetical protein